METISRSLLTFLLNSLWQIPLAAAVALLVCRLMRNGPAVHRHAVWVAALAAAVLLPVASMRHGPPTPTPQFDGRRCGRCAEGPRPSRRASASACCGIRCTRPVATDHLLRRNHRTPF